MKIPENPEFAQLQPIIDQLLKDKSKIKVLEAGCGSASHFSFGERTLPTAYLPDRQGRQVEMVGIDVSQEQLDKNTDLNEKILGDIQSYQLPAEEFDAIICWNVLEHLPHPEKALTNFARAGKKDGIIILAMPNVWSFKGLITKLTPHWFHVLVVKYIFGNKKAGQPGEWPFKTYLRWSISPRAIKKFAQNNKLQIKYFKAYESCLQETFRQGNIIYDALMAIPAFLVKIITLGKVNFNLTDFIIVLQK